MTMKTILRAILLFSFVFFSWGCNNNPAAGSSDSYFASVVDESGHPIADVAMHYVYQLKSKDQLPKGTKTCPSTNISYSIPAVGHVSLTIHRWYTKELLATLVDTILNAGTYRTLFDATQFTNGIYLYRLAYGTTVIERPMALLVLDMVALSATTPFATTDAEGRLDIPIGMFGFDVPLLSTSAITGLSDTVYVSRAIEIMLVKQGYATFLQSVLVSGGAFPINRFVMRRL
jgi:hypothetical protein